MAFAAMIVEGEFVIAGLTRIGGHCRQNRNGHTCDHARQ
jgi:hypothetical protein